MRIEDLLEQRLFEVTMVPSAYDEILPLKDSDTIRVYHGTSSLEMIYSALNHGISGDSIAPRRYSYEMNNNPRGIFVTPDLKTAKEFGQYVIEFHTRVHDLEAPVWPGGVFTVQGGISGIFTDEQEREQERIASRMEWSQSELEGIRNSDRPELAASLMVFGERQALFTGNLNANSIRAIWSPPNPEMSSKYQSLTRMSPSEFLKSIQGEAEHIERGSTFRASKKKVVEPREMISGSEFIDRFLAQVKVGISREEVIDIILKNPDYIESRVWNRAQASRILNDLELGRG